MLEVEGQVYGIFTFDEHGRFDFVRMKSTSSLRSARMTCSRDLVNCIHFISCLADQFEFLNCFAKCFLNF